MVTLDSSLPDGKIPNLIEGIIPIDIESLGTGAVPVIADITFYCRYYFGRRFTECGCPTKADHKMGCFER